MTEGAIRFLIVNADDFGRTPGINRGIVEAHERGIVTSASLMVRWPAARQAAAYARARSDFSLGLHVDLGEWVCGREGWAPVYEVVPAGAREAVRAEVRRQLYEFRRLAGHDPSHLDSHQHRHRENPLRSVLRDLARELAVPLRDFDPVVRYCGDFYGQLADGRPYPDGIGVEALTRILRNLPAGVTELGCHPGGADATETAYTWERAAETAVLCDQRIRTTVASERIELCSFAHVHRRSCP